jgi:hypothetical protein
MSIRRIITALFRPKHYYMDDYNSRPVWDTNRTRERR